MEHIPYGVRFLTRKDFRIELGYLESKLHEAYKYEVNLRGKGTQYAVPSYRLPYVNLGS